MVNTCANQHIYLAITLKEYRRKQVLYRRAMAAAAAQVVVVKTAADGAMQYWPTHSRERLKRTKGRGGEKD